MWSIWWYLWDAYHILVAAAKSLQLCLTLGDPIDGSPSGSPVPGILQARTLDWVAISFSNAWTWKVKVKSFSCIWLLVTPWTAAHQALQSMWFSRQEYWSGLPLPSPLSHSKYSIMYLLSTYVCNKIMDTNTHTHTHIYIHTQNGLLFSHWSPH